MNFGANFGIGNMDPRMLQQLGVNQGGGQVMGQMRPAIHGQPELLQPQQYQPPQTANLGFPSMPGQQPTPGLHPGAANQQMSQMGEQFGQGWQGLPGQESPGGKFTDWWGANQGNVGNALWAMQSMF